MTLMLPYPPSANNCWKVFRGRAVKSEEARAYQRIVKLKNLRVVPIHGEVAVHIDFHRPAKRGDLDNMQKVLIDALKGIAYLDDEQISELSAIRHEGTPATARAEVTVTAIGDES